MSAHTVAAACSSGGPGAPSSGCEWTRPVILDPADELTDDTARQILAHNEAWRRICD